MARPKSFDEGQVLTCAMMTFWRLGFDATTYKVLEGETGVGVRSMHNTFGEKEELFLKALDAYHANVSALMEQVFNPPGVAAIAMIFQGTTAPKEEGDIAHAGCLMVNTVFELPDRSEEIDGRLNAYKSMLRDRFRMALEQDGIAEADKRAEFLVGALWGILSQVRLAGRADAGAPMASVILETIEGWR